MTKIATIASLVALVMSSAQATAGVREAAFDTAADRPHTRTAMFVGGTYRLGLDGRGDARRGRATLKLAGSVRLPGRTEMRLADGFEIGRGQGGKAALFIAGRDAGQLGKQMNLSGGETALVVVGGLLVVGGVLMLIGRESMDGGTLDY